MTDIDFYIVASDSPQARELMACRLAEKVYKMGRNVHIHTVSASESQTLDRLLWSFRDGSFIPHTIAEQINPMDEVAPIIISHSNEVNHHSDVLINLTDKVPLFFSRFKRVSEIITDKEKTVGRERFKFYRDRGYSLKSHNIQ